MQASFSDLEHEAKKRLTQRDRFLAVLGRILEKIEYYKASVRAKVERPFHVIKNLLGLKKVRYRGLAKNTARLYTLFGLANLMIAGRGLEAQHS